jgi:disulfide bond formation protein DsbB
VVPLPGGQRRLFAPNPALRHTDAMRIRGQRRAGIIVAAGALLALCVAYFAEYRLRLVPCPLCLLERWPYWITVVLGFFAALAPRLGRFFLALAVLALLAGVAIAFIHVGVEQGWWPSPLPECNAPPPSFGSLPLRPSISCSAPSFLIPGLPLSMALMDMIYALAFASLLIIYLKRDNRSVS